MVMGVAGESSGDDLGGVVDFEEQGESRASRTSSREYRRVVSPRAARSAAHRSPAAVAAAPMRSATSSSGSAQSSLSSMWLRVSSRPPMRARSRVMVLSFLGLFGSDAGTVRTMMVLPPG